MLIRTTVDGSHNGAPATKNGAVSIAFETEQSYLNGQRRAFLRPVGTTFEACLGFTRVRARTIANLSARQCTQGFNGRVTTDAAWVATEAHRQVLGWNFHPLVLRTFSWRTDKVVLIVVY